MSKRQSDQNQPDQNKPTAESEEERKRREARDRLRNRFGAAGAEVTQTESLTQQQVIPPTPAPVVSQPGAGAQPPGQVVYVPVQAAPPVIQPQVPPTQPVQPPAEVPLLYKSQPSAKWYNRKFDRKYHKGGATYNPYQLGAFEALSKLLDRDKYKLQEEMMDMLFERYQDVLEGRPDVVREFEREWHDSFDI